MTSTLPSFLNDARGLVLENRLMEATALIQRRLNGGGEIAPAPAPDPRPAAAFDSKTIEGQAERIDASGPRQASAAKLRTRPRFPMAGIPKASKRRAAMPLIPEGAQFLHLRHEDVSGCRAYRLYIPATSPSGPRPLLVMLHGCTQSPEDFAAGTRMNRLAEETGMLVAYPEQERSANATLCWNWFEPNHQERDAGEPAILAGIVRAIAREHAVDRGRIFVAGLSAGGAMAAILGVTHPDLFNAVGVHSGLAHGSAANVATALSVMRSGKSSRHGRRIGTRAIVFHGTRDTTVHPANGDQLAGLIGGSAIGAETVEGVAGGRAYSRTFLPGVAKAPATEYWRVEGLGHAWSGGDAAGSYTDPTGPDASRAMIRFFLR